MQTNFDYIHDLVHAVRLWLQLVGGRDAAVFRVRGSRFQQIAPKVGNNFEEEMLQSNRNAWRNCRVLPHQHKQRRQRCHFSQVLWLSRLWSGQYIQGNIFFTKKFT